MSYIPIWIFVGTFSSVTWWLKAERLSPMSGVRTPHRVFLLVWFGLFLCIYMSGIVYIYIFSCIFYHKSGMTQWLRTRRPSLRSGVRHPVSHVHSFCDFSFLFCMFCVHALMSANRIFPLTAANRIFPTCVYLCIYLCINLCISVSYVLYISVYMSVFC